MEKKLSKKIRTKVDPCSAHKPPHKPAHKAKRTRLRTRLSAQALRVTTAHNPLCTTLRSIENA